METLQPFFWVHFSFKIYLGKHESDCVVESHINLFIYWYLLPTQYITEEEAHIQNTNKKWTSMVTLSPTQSIEWAQFRKTEKHTKETCSLNASNGDPNNRLKSSQEKPTQKWRNRRRVTPKSTPKLQPPIEGTKEACQKKEPTSNNANEGTQTEVAGTPEQELYSPSKRIAEVCG